MGNSGGHYIRRRRVGHRDQYLQQMNYSKIWQRVGGFLIAKVVMVFFFLLAGAVWADAGRQFPEVALGDRKLVLNGQATRTVWGFPVYDVGLFLEKVSRDGNLIMNGDSGAKQVRLKMLRTVSREDFAGAVKESIARNLSASEISRFGRELSLYESLLETFGNIPAGSTVTIDYLPNRGMVVGIDGKTIGTVKGHEFYHVMLRLWIGSPAQESVKRGLLAAG